MTEASTPAVLRHGPKIGDTRVMNGRIWRLYEIDLEVERWVDIGPPYDQSLSPEGDGSLQASPSVPTEGVTASGDGWPGPEYVATAKDIGRGPIKFVAVRYGERVVVGPMPGFRHHHIITIASQLGFRNAQPDDQGFSTDGETFTGREEAARLALESGQVTKLIAPPNLYSEDCW